MEQHHHTTSPRAASDAETIDFRQLFEAMPGLFLVLAPDLRVLDASNAYLEVSRVERADLVGRELFDVFTDANPANPLPTGVANLRASFRRVVNDRVPDEMQLQRFDIVNPDGTFEERYWRALNTPVLAANGAVRYIIHRVEDVTSDAKVQANQSATRRELESSRHQEAVVTVELEAQAVEIGVVYQELKKHSLHLQAEVERQVGEIKSGIQHRARLLVERRLLAGERDTLWNLSTDLLSVTGLDGYFKRVNPAFYKVLGWSEADLTASPFIDFIHPDDVAATESDVAKLGEGRVIKFESRFRTRLGDYRWLAWQTTPSEDLFYSVARDVTEQKAAEAELKRERELNARIVANAPAGIAYLNCDLVFEWVNPMYADLVGVPVERLLGQSIYEGLGEETKARIEPYCRKVLTGEAHYGVAFPFNVTADPGHLGYWDFTFQPIADDDGEVYAVLILCTDVSARVEREQHQLSRVNALEEAERLKDQFLGILSHELRTPINAIMGFGSILEDELAGPLNAVQHKYIGKVITASDSLLALVSDLLDMSRMQAGSFTVRPHRTSLGVAIQEVLGTCAPVAEAKQITLHADVPADLPALMADQVRVTQVLSNMVGNALKFTQAGGQVEVRARAVAGSLRVEVEDNGPGIDSSAHGALFEPFTQVDMSSTRRAGGVGLGLAICKSLILAHGGDIGVRSREGGGSTFWFTLPLGGLPP
ncbi:MAG: sensor signal transduction histidine kinase [Cyanobacteria bacterium RYN_339]|nr:sensor signal transduction histidine kinase [Cyanobacteria bacterium RYN_339]